MFRNCERGICKGVLIGISSALLAITFAHAQNSAASFVPPTLTVSTSSELPIAAPGWVSLVAEPVSPEQARHILGTGTPELDESAPPARFSAALATPGNYTALAEALENDPLRIYQYVRNHFEYVPYFGLLKGPYLTLHERSGNDFDQAALLIELLRAAGITAKFKYGTVAITDAFGVQAVASWLGTAADLQLIFKVLSNGGIPTSLSGSTLKFDHVWVEATINQATVMLDPAFKLATWHSAINLGTAMNYTEAGMLGAAGGIATANSIKDMDEVAAANYLRDRSTDLRNYLKTHHPNARVEDVLGGYDIVPENSSNLPTSLPLAVTGTPLTWTTVPANYIHQLQLVHGGINLTKHIPEIAGRKVSLSYLGDSIVVPSPPAEALDYGRLEINEEGPIYGLGGTNTTGDTLQVVSALAGPNASAFVFTQGGGSQTVAKDAPISVSVRFTGVGQTPGRKNAVLTLKYYYRGTLVAGPETHDLTGVVESDRIAQLYIDDQLVASEGTPSGDRNKLRLVINHPYAALTGTFADQTRDFALKRSGSYVIVSAFGSGKDSTLLGERQRLLNRMSVDGTPPGASRRLTETLNVIGQTWMQQTQLNTDLLDALSRKRTIVHHRFGIAAQKEGYSIDMAAQVVAPSDRVVNNPVGDTLKTDSFVASAMEHSVLDQLQGISNSDGVSNPAASTIRLLALASWAGDRLFVINNSNYASTSSQLSNYTSEQLSVLQSRVSASHTLVIPEHGAIPLGDWTGLGYVDYSEVGQQVEIGMVIDGGLNGGFGTKPGTASAVAVQKDFNPEITLKKDIPVTLVQDPVDLGTGAFFSSITDFGVAGSGTRGFAFTRSYNSQMAGQDTAGLGRGWTHNYNVYLSKHSDIEAALGKRTAFDAIPMVVVNHIARSLLQAPYPTPKNWGVAVLVANWGMDQLLNKSITVHMGSEALTFQEMPNGEFMPPPGITTKLVRTAGKYELRERFGTVWKFDDKDHIASITDVDGKTMSFTYNSDGRLGQVKDANARTLYLRYTNDDLVQAYDSTYHSVTYGQTNGNLTTVTGLEGDKWTYVYDQLQRLLKVKNPVNVQIVDNTYNDFDRVIAQLAPRDTGLETYKMHYAGFLASEEDPERNRTTYHFDRDGRRVAIENALGDITRIVYDGQGQMIGQTDPQGNSSKFAYDNDNNLKEQINTNGKKVSFAYDTQHRLAEIRDPLNHKVTFAYNTKNHLTDRVDHYGHKVKTTYLSNGLVDTVTDPRQTRTVYNYDAYGYLKTALTGGHPAVNWKYNARGDLENLVDQEGAMTSFIYDNRGLVKEKTDPRGKKSFLEYTAAGELKKSTDRNNKVTRFTYTGSGKLDVITYPGTTVNFNYDSRDNLVEMIDGTGTTSNTYDAAGRLTSHSDSNGHSVGYVYDAAGNLTTLTYPPGNKKVMYTYDSLNRLSTVTIDWLAGKPTMRYVYDDANRLDRVEHFNAMETDYTWDDTDQLTGIAHEGATALVKYNFMLDTNGNRVQETVSPTPTMVGSSITDDTSFAYNLQRNRLNSTSKHSYTYGTEGQLTGTVDTLGKLYGYDNEGQLTAKDTVAFTFDDAHRLIQRGTDTFVYDGVGNRLKAIRGVAPNRAEIRYVYDAAGNLLAQASASGQITRYYIYGAGLVAMVQSSTYYVYHFDGTGHTVALTNAGNAVVNKYTYSPYGKVLGQEQVPQPFKYAGQIGIFSESDNLYYMRARYYDAETGRFIAEDPAGFVDGPNLYAYVGGNPVNAVDPQGNLALPVVTGIIGGVSGLVGACSYGCSAKEAVIGLGTGAVTGAVGGTARIVQFVGTSVLRNAGVGSGLAATSNIWGQTISIMSDQSKTFDGNFSGAQVGLSLIGGALGGAKTAMFGQTVVERVAAGFVSLSNQLPFALFGASSGATSAGNATGGK